MRVVATNDFVGSFFPQPTSYGELPGAAALQATVDDLRTRAGAAAWIDTGDLAQGSALGALSDGVWPFVALRSLSIDAAVVGNHELDWGRAHLRRWSAELPFPLLAANLPGFPATRLVPVGGGALGVVGVSLPELALLHPGAEVETDTAGVVARHAAALRAAGAERVVLALHDGVDADVGRMERLCEAVRGSVDLVLGGHTLRCFAGTLAGVPFLQPWAFGSQVGVADLDEDGVALRLVDVAEARPFPVPGAAAQAALEAEVVGRLDAPLIQAAGRDASLAEAVAGGLVRADSGVDVAYIGPGDLWNQPARDGVDAFVGAGDVTLAQVLRLCPLCGGRSAWGGQLVAAELPASAVDAVVGALRAGGGFPGGLGVPGVAARRHGRSGSSVVAMSPYNAAAADRALRREHGWARVGATWREGLLAVVAR